MRSPCLILLSTLVLGAGCGKTVLECVDGANDPACARILGCNGVVDAAGVCQPEISRCEGVVDADGVCQSAISRCEGIVDDDGVCQPAISRCEGIVDADGVCQPVITRCEGILDADGVCQPVISRCDGILDADGVCQPVITRCDGTFDPTGVCYGMKCGVGTRQEGSLCVADPTGEGPQCGEGTVESNGACVPDGSQCGEGTRLELGRCVVADPQVPRTCAEGTREEDGACVADCGPGTVLSGTTCVVAQILSCGPGTVELDGECVGSVSCGPGTVLDEGQCTATPSGWFDIRIGALIVPADGYTKIPFLALGRDSSGSPSRDEVVITLSRATAGTVSPVTTILSALGTNGYLTACNSATSGACEGTARLRLALASDPSTILAESEEFALVAPAGVGSMAPCQAFQNALHLDGAGYIYRGTQTVSLGSFSLSAMGTAPDLVSVYVDPSDSAQGSYWSLSFSSRRLAQPLNPQVYVDAERYPFESTGRPGLSVTGDHRGCNQLSGSFQIHRLGYTGNTLTHLEATFLQYCEKNPSNWLRGCIRISP